MLKYGGGGGGGGVVFSIRWVRYKSYRACEIRLGGVAEKPIAVVAYECCKPSDAREAANGTIARVPVEYPGIRHGTSVICPEREPTRSPHYTLGRCRQQTLAALS